MGLLALPPTQKTGSQFGELRRGSSVFPLDTQTSRNLLALSHECIFIFLFLNSFMDISRMKKLFAGVSAVAISITQVGVALAAYSDVPAGVWYEEAVDAFTDAGYLDGTQTRFRGGDNANRAEFTKLVVELNGGILSTPPAVASFDDVKAGAWYYGYMEEAAKEGWVKGDGNCYGSHPCYARPGANINRAEAAALIVRAFGLEATGDAPSFVDVPNGQWYTASVQTAADYCVLQGDDATGRARPADFMNRAEMVTMLYRVDQNLMYGVDCSTDPATEPLITDVTPTSATTIEVEFNMTLDEDAMVDASHYMVTGFADLDVESVEMIDESTVELTLGESMDAGEDYTLSVEDMMTEDGESFSDTMDFEGYEVIEQGDGILEVSVASTNPAADTVPQGAQGVVMMSVDLTASCDDDVIISELTVLHEGFGDDSDISGVYASIDGARVSRKRTLDSQDQTADLRFTSPLTVSACQTVTLDIVADFDTTLTAGAEHNLALELPADFQSNALDVEGNFPVRGNTFRIAAVTSGSIEVDYRTVSPNEIDVGDTKKVLGKFELSANSVEDQTVYSITLEQNGSASDGDVVNLQIRRSDGTVLTNTVAATVADYVTFVFDPPFTVLEGDNITFEIVGDVEGGAGETVSFHVEETGDLFAVGSLYGYGVNGQLYGSQVSIPNDDADEVTIQAGEFTVELNGPVQQKYTADSDDAILANISFLTGGESLDVQDMFVAIEGETSTGAGLLINGGTSSDQIHEVLEDIELRNKKTGQTISAVRLTTGSDISASTTAQTYQVYRFDDFIVDGASDWELRVDFIENTGGHPRSGDRFVAHVCTAVGTATCFTNLISGGTDDFNMVIEGLSTGDTVTDVRPGTTITGNYHRIASPELNVSVIANANAESAVKNSKNINLLRFEARAGEAEDILFTSATFESFSGSLLNGQNYALWVDTDGDGVVDTILEKGVSAQNNAVAFDELAGGGYVIPAEETVTFEVHADIAANFVGTPSLKIRFDTGATYIEAEQVDDGSSLSGISTNGSSATAEIKVTTADSKLWTLTNQGDLFVSKDTSESIQSRQLLGGATGEGVLRLNLRASNEDIDVTDLQINSSGSNASSVLRLDLFKQGETTSFATATVTGCGSDDVLGVYNAGGGTSTAFCANMESQQLVVPRNSDLDIIVRPVMKTDNAGATSGQDIVFFVGKQAVSNSATGSGAVRARGLQSSLNLTANDADSTADGEVFIGRTSVATTNLDIIGNKNEVVLAKITSIANAGAASGVIPSGTAQPIGSFRFQAAANSNSLNGTNRATLSGVIFTVSATNVDLDGGSFKFYNASDASTKANCSVLGSASTSGALSVQCASLPSSSVSTSMESNQSATFVLEATVSNPNITGNSTLQVSLTDFSSISNTTFGASNSHINWLDQDTSTTFFYWIEYPVTVVNSTSWTR